MALERFRSFEVRLGVLQVIVLLGLMLGSLASAFYLGLMSGQRVGFERAFASAAANVPPLPILDRDAEERVDPAISAEVYARLQEPLKNPEPLPTAPLAPVVELERVPLDGLLAATPPSSVTAGLADEIPERASATPQSELGSRVEKARDVAAIARVTAIPTPKVVEPAPPEEKPMRLVGSTSVPVRKVLAKGWYAQIAAPRKQSEAEAIGRRLLDDGFPVVIEVANVRGDEYFRVIVGPENSRQLAERLVEQLKRQRASAAEPFIRVVK